MFSAIAASLSSAAALITLNGLSMTAAVAAPDQTPLGSAALTPPTAIMPAPMGRLAKGTLVWVRLRTALRAGQCKSGDAVAFTVAQDVFGPGRVRLLASGATGVGHITESVGHRSFGRAGRLVFTCDAVFGGSSGSLRVPVLLSVRPQAKDDTTLPVPPPAGPPLADLHSSGPINGDLLAGTPLDQANRPTSQSVTFTLGGGPDATADAGDTFEATVASDTDVPVLPAPPPVAVVLPLGAVRIDPGNLDTALPSTDKDMTWIRSLVQKCLQEGYTAVKMADGSIVMTPAQGSISAPMTVMVKKG